jgi:hypothetical protein
MPVRCLVAMRCTLQLSKTCTDVHTRSAAKRDRKPGLGGVAKPKRMTDQDGALIGWFGNGSLLTCFRSRTHNPLESRPAHCTKLKADSNTGKRDIALCTFTVTSTRTPSYAMPTRVDTVEPATAGGPTTLKLRGSHTLPATSAYPELEQNGVSDTFCFTTVHYSLSDLFVVHSGQANTQS